MTRRSLGADSSAQNVAKLGRRATDRYELELANHFEIEEQVLFPACGEMPLIAQLVSEHRAIEGLIAELRSAPSGELLEKFCALLAGHIRREENKLFEKIQRAGPGGGLERAGSENDPRAGRSCFWGNRSLTSPALVLSERK